MVTLALDISTHTGWAILDNGKVTSSGTIHLATVKQLQDQRKAGKERTEDMRFAALYDFIASKLPADPTQVVFEDVQFSSTQMQSQLWASLRAAIWAVARVHGKLVINCVPVGTLKSFATGSGSAKKPQMAEALAKLYPGSSVTVVKEVPTLHRPGMPDADDNEVDAIWLALYAKAVEDGKESFSGVYKRKMEEKAEKRKKKAEKRLAKGAKLALKTQVKSVKLADFANQ